MEGLRRYDAPIAAGMALAAWSVFLLDTLYLEPLPSDAGTLGVRLLVLASFGAGLCSGWRWATIAVAAAGAIGLIHVSGSLAYREPDGPIAWNSTLRVVLVAMPLAVAVGALASLVIAKRLAVGAIVLAAPIVVGALAGYRHAKPIDVRPANPMLIELRAFPNPPPYRGVTIRSDQHAMRAMLGPADERRHNSLYGALGFRYGADWVLVGGDGRRLGVSTFLIADPRAETRDGIGIGDNLSLVRERYRSSGPYCDSNNSDFRPHCDVTTDGGHTHLFLTGDPIEQIVVDYYSS